MANIKFSCIKKSNPSNLNIRFYLGKKIDCNAQSHILVNPNDWSEKMQNFKPNTDINIKNHCKPLIDNLKKEILVKYNIDHSNGVIIDSKWLKKTVQDFHKRPEGIEEYKIYFVPFVEKFIEDSKIRRNPISGKTIAENTIKKYVTTLNKIKEFEKTYDTKLRITDINIKFHEKLTHYLKDELNYSGTYIAKVVNQIKLFVREAKEQKLEINDEIESRKFTYKTDETFDTYLNPSEIDLIYNLNLTHNESLDNARDLFIIGLWTGLRISDLKNINYSLFTKNTLVVPETEKTGKMVEIPIHPQVRKILDKRLNELPKVISTQKFNDYIKELCRLAGITEEIFGNIKNPITNRKEKGLYPKYKLISSHTARRSFATNHYGELPDRTIMACTGHKSLSQFHKYLKTTQKDHIEKLNKYWEQQDELKNPKPVLKRA